MGVYKKIIIHTDVMNVFISPVYMDCPAFGVGLKNVGPRNHRLAALQRHMIASSHLAVNCCGRGCDSDRSSFLALMKL